MGKSKDSFYGNFANTNAKPGSSNDAFAKYSQAANREACRDMDDMDDWESYHSCWKEKEPLIELMRPGGMILDYDKD